MDFSTHHDPSFRGKKITITVADRTAKVRGVISWLPYAGMHFMYMCNYVYICVFILKPSFGPLHQDQSEHSLFSFIYYMYIDYMFDIYIYIYYIFICIHIYLCMQTFATLTTTLLVQSMFYLGQAHSQLQERVGLGKVACLHMPYW